MGSSYRDISEQFIEEASFLWLLRSIAQNQPHYLPSDVADLERRIDASLDGLLVSSEEVWEICLRALEYQAPGEVFVAAIVAFQSLDSKKVQCVVDAGLSDPALFDALVSAIAWLPAEMSAPWVDKFLRSKALDHKCLSIAVHSALRQDPGDYLSSLLSREDCLREQYLYCRTLRLAGELKRVDLRDALRIALNDAREVVQFWAGWSLLLLGDTSVLRLLRTFVLAGGDFCSQAAALYFRAAPLADAKSAISELAKTPATERLAIQASAVLGDTLVVPWLLSKMERSEVSRVAAESFTQITGIHLEDNNLSIEIPRLSLVPNDDPQDEGVELDEDDSLPWPNVEKLKATWQHYGGQFPAGSRYFLGRKITLELLREQLQVGYQRHRKQAALELALRDASQPLVNVYLKV